MKIDELTRIIIEYGEKYERDLKVSGYDSSIIDRKLNEWIKDKLQYVKDNPNITKVELIAYINEYNKERKLK